ncbi:hypothetical protein LOTGIDRAFT_161037 [Lottia gigantea]|uniref:Uncharacterized protein n=1 Tax=Lottia gigantea TaxID=225164 RepID=V4AMD4_LOTGI|nr:hypothetical protein LOTGIDRAFT_161037 [Lottia gigantea]ESO94786.1 hypothetical protein LOTGIDRAFT_161037 [Lottia gigantea]
MEKLAAEVKKPKTEKKGSEVGDMIGTIKEFGKRFGEQTKKTVKQGLNKLVDSIDSGEVKVKHKDDESDDYAEDYTPIIQEIDEFDDMVASGQGITFLSDNNEELLNRLRAILAAMEEGHRSHRQYNEVNFILKRLLKKVS